MRKFFNIFLTALVSIFLFYGCQASDPNIETAKLNLKKKNYQSALKATQAAIKEDSTNATAYYYKGYIYSKLAESKANPANRYQDFKDMSQAYSKAQKLYSQQKSQPKEAMLMKMSTLSLWTHEHNSAIKLVAHDSTRTPANLKKAIAYLRNATAIQPDSLISWEVLAEVYNMDKNLPGAEKTLKEAINIKPKSDVNMYLRLAAFYDESKKYDDAIEILSKAKKMYPDNVKVVQQLANTYLAKNDTENAISTVASLIKNDPNNAQYRLVYGTEIYKMALDMNDKLTKNFTTLSNLNQELSTTSSRSKKNELKAKINQLNQANDSLQTKIDDLSGKAEVQLKKTIELRPKDATAYHTIGIIYQNKAAALYEKRNSTTNNKMAAKYDKEARQTLEKALPYYEKAAQIKPNNKDYWQSLFKVYTQLGMNKKAAEAMKKAGLSN